MTALQMLTLAGLLTAGGLVLMVRALRPAHPSLMAALAQLSAEPTTPTTIPANTDPAGDRRGWLPAAVTDRVEAHLGVSDADLAIIGWTRTQLATRKIALAATGLLAPALLAVFLLFLGLGQLVVFPGIVAIALAGVLWFLPSQQAREDATKARAEFRTNLESFLTLVAGERRARGSVEQALEAASEVSGSMPFVRINRTIQRATLSTNRKIWDDLRDLGEHLQVPELRNLADIASVAADGGAVYKTLLATSRTLRHAELSDQRAKANQASESMSRPLALLVASLTLFVLIPFMLRMFGAST